MKDGIKYPICRISADLFFQTAEALCTLGHIDGKLDYWKQKVIIVDKSEGMHNCAVYESEAGEEVLSLAAELKFKRFGDTEYYEEPEITEGKVNASVPELRLPFLTF